MTKRKGDPIPFGWCLDGHHAECWKTIHLSMQDETRTCVCKCHGEEK